MIENALGEKLRTAHDLVLGCFGNTALAPNGEPYVTLHGFGGEPEAARAFAEYVNGRAGVLHWRVVPETTYATARAFAEYVKRVIPEHKAHVSASRGQYFYMRLLLETGEHDK